MEQQEIDVYKKLEEISAAEVYPALYESDPEKARMISEHMVWLKSIRHQRPPAAAPFKIGVYIRYFNQTKYENYLKFHEKQFADTIALCPAWSLIDFYIDEGASPPNMESSQGWSRLMEDCMAGKIDLIITQKVSNVSKNPQELSFCARMLASLPHPVGIYFVSEDIFTLATYYMDDLKDFEFLPDYEMNGNIEEQSNGGLLNG